MSWSPDSKSLLSASGDKTCKVWDVESGELVADFPMGSELEDQQMSCMWVGNFLLSISLSGFINYLDLENPSKPKKIVKVIPYPRWYPLIGWLTLFQSQGWCSVFPIPISFFLSYYISTVKSGPRAKTCPVSSIFKTWLLFKACVYDFRTFSQMPFFM